MKQKDISSREDVHLLVKHFCIKIRKEPAIGHFFNETIEDWDEHEEKLTDFWESNLFFKSKNNGNPKKAHLDIDRFFYS